LIFGYVDAQIADVKHIGKERNYDQFDHKQLWRNMSHYNMLMTDKARKVGEALLLYWWVYCNSEN